MYKETNQTLSLLEKVRAKRLAMLAGSINQANQANTTKSQPEANSGLITTLDRYGKTIQLNLKQSEFVNLISQGKSCVLLGAAGTGKTTCQGAAAQALIQSGLAGILKADGHKSLTSGTPGIVICAYTRRAVTNIKKSLPKDLQGNCVTIHKLLGYKPNFLEVYDDKSGEYKKSMRFEPAYDAGNPLPSSIKVIIFEESSMLGTDLHQKVMDACPHNPQIIYLGDIQQLPPTFGAAILGYKLLELPTIELTEVYRQALESPILSLAWKIIRGETFPGTEFANLTAPAKLTLRPWKKKVDKDVALGTLRQFLTQAAENGQYDPAEDMILMPQIVGCGTAEINKSVANYLAKKHDKVVYNVLSGFNSLYFSVGDKVMFDKEDAEIIDIVANPEYSGRQPQFAGKTLDYWGNDSSGGEEIDFDSETSEETIEAILARAGGDSEDRVKQSSHCITLRFSSVEDTMEISTAGDVNKLLLGYALNVHKAQGSEWNKVFFFAHESNATMLYRELLYTAVTRAREELIVICPPDMFQKGIMSQRIKGNTLAEKAEFFKGKVRANQQFEET